MTIKKIKRTKKVKKTKPTKVNVGTARNKSINVAPQQHINGIYKVIPETIKEIGVFLNQLSYQKFMLLMIFLSQVVNSLPNILKHI